MGKEGFTVWFTGWSGAGKSTLADMLKEQLQNNGVQHIQILDGDIVRKDLTRDLGFSKEDRDENIRRVTFVAQLLSNNGVATIAAFISPYRAERNNARQRCKNFIEVYVKCDRDELIRRDPKGLYKKAIAGEIKEFTGISDPYEEPEKPELILETDKDNPEKCLDLILIKLKELNLI